jgi:hypothetical protein
MIERPDLESASSVQAGNILQNGHLTKPRGAAFVAMYLDCAKMTDGTGTSVSCLARIAIGSNSVKQICQIRFHSLRNSFDVYQRDVSHAARFIAVR